jgi:signal transduction histidine kinase/CheY-like chemotaxis protein
VRDELLEPASWQELLQGYARATKLAVMMVDTTGAPLGRCISPHQIWEFMTDYGSSRTSPCPFCLHPEPGCQAVAEAGRAQKVAFARDRAGFVHIAVPVTVAGRVIAFILAGQVFDRFPEQLLLDDLARKTRRPSQRLWELARRELPVGRPLLQAYGELLSTLAESYVRARYAGIVDRQRYAEILGLHADLAERQQIEAALREADRRKDEFLAMLAHELRNPLAPMTTAVHLLKSDKGSQGTRERAMATLSRQLRHMVRLVDDLLDFSRITRGHIDLQRRRIRLSEIIASAVETSRPEIDQKHHTLTIEDATDDVLLDVDPVRISQALANLLSNAARYMEPQGRIRLTSECDADVVTVKVTDRGVGLTRDLIGHVFDMFVRGSYSQGAAPGGLGIGLTLAKMLIEMHGGTIDARSDGPGLGSEFTIRLPKADTDASESSYDVIADRTDIVANARKVLIVEDNDDSRDLLAQALMLKGHDIRSVGDGPSALHVVSTWHPDVAVLDIGLPGMSGHELALQLKERAELRDIVLIALTGWGQEQDRLRSAAAGIDHHLTKPVDPEELDRLLTLSAITPNAERCERRRDTLSS